MQHLRTVILALFLLNLCTCQSDPYHDIRPFYFPINELEEGLVYEFSAVNHDSIAPEYWYYKTLKTDTATYLTGTFYNAALQITQVFGEEVVKNGTVMHQYLLYETDTAGLQQPIEVDIQVPNVMPFQVRDTQGIFLFKLQWKNREMASTDSTAFIDRTTTLIRNRRYKGTQSFEVMGTEKDCVVFEVREIIETEEVGFQELEINGEERYAEGIGLVYYRKEISPELTLEYELTDRFPMDQLIQQYDQMNEVNE